MKDIKISHIRTEPISPILPQGVCGVPNTKKVRLGSLSRPHRPHGAKSALYVCAKFWYLSFKTGSVKKYLKFPLEKFLKFQISKIKIFTPTGIPRKRKTVKKWFQKLLGSIPGCRIEAWRNLEVKKREIEIGLNSSKRFINQSKKKSAYKILDVEIFWLLFDVRFV